MLSQKDQRVGRRYIDALDKGDLLSYEKLPNSKHLQEIWYNNSMWLHYRLLQFWTFNFRILSDCVLCKRVKI